VSAKTIKLTYSNYFFCLCDNAHWGRAAAKVARLSDTDSIAD
jgi:hypothetical protein